MIPYEELCDALARWRANNGLAVRRLAEPPQVMMAAQPDRPPPPMNVEEPAPGATPQMFAAAAAADALAAADDLAASDELATVATSDPFAAAGAADPFAPPPVADPFAETDAPQATTPEIIPLEDLRYPPGAEGPEDAADERAQADEAPAGKQQETTNEIDISDIVDEQDVD